MTDNNEPMRILVAIDGSESARLGVDFAAGLALPAGSTIVIVEAEI